MLHRCIDPTNKHYFDYGGRGIKVCTEWYSIAKFINDVEVTYKEGLTLDRIDNNKGYSKENCKWSTITEQNNNRRKPKVFKNNKTGKQGIYFCKSSLKFHVRIQVNFKTKHIGRFIFF